jgi:hypothetical protein
MDAASVSPIPRAAIALAVAALTGCGQSAVSPPSSAKLAWGEAVLARQAGASGDPLFMSVIQFAH